MHAEVHASRALLHEPWPARARRPREGDGDPRPFEFDSRGIKGIKGGWRGGEEEIEGLVGSRVIGSSFCFERGEEGIEGWSGAWNDIEERKKEGGCSLVRREGSKHRHRCLMFYARVYIRVQLETGRELSIQPLLYLSLCSPPLLPPCYRLNGY